ncbi:U11/U12 small nuclear ribonucleoprotein 35 kDa protein-like [Bolinopsis microptera]|uniref:U11/U12 small nuclear ribonucleoprotein 35 kDa protein-like n=1 Tax=Bolinopsis microptera TaxID=2820187 RepID=UPI0030792F83
MAFDRTLKVYDPLKAGSIDGTDKIPHDKAINRAMNANYLPRNCAKSSRTLFVGRLSSTTDTESLEKCFRKYGRISNCRVVQDPVTLESRRYGFVTFSKIEDTDYAREQTNNVKLDNSVLFVDYENSHNMKGWVPRRLGGGFGGDKKSGQLRFGGRDRPFKAPILLTSDRTITSNYDTKHSSCRNERHQKHRKRSNNRESGDEKRSKHRSRDNHVRTGHNKNSRSEKT